MILFPTVPATYDAPSVSLASPTTAFKEVCSASLITSMTLNYTRNDAGTASQYTFFVNSSSVCVCNPPTATTTQTFNYGYTPNVPKAYTFCGNISYLEGAVCNDSSGNPSLPNIPAGTCTTSPQTLTYIFPYYHGTVSSTCTTITAADIISPTNTEFVNYATSPSVAFNSSNSNTKGFLAIPTAAGIQPAVSYCAFYDQSNLKQVLPGGIFPSAPIVVPSVSINGVSHTYSVYLFDYGSETTGTWNFCS